MQVISLRFSAAVVLALLTLPAALGIQAQSAGLFTAISETVTKPGPLADMMLRERRVTIDFVQLHRTREAAALRQPAQIGAAEPRSQRTLLSEPGAVLTLNLFNDVVVRSLVERTAPTFSGGYSISGGIVGEPLGSVTLVVNGETVAGTVRLAGATYEIESVDDGLYTIRQVEEPPLQCAVPETGAASPDRSDR